MILTNGKERKDFSTCIIDNNYYKGVSECSSQEDVEES